MEPISLISTGIAVAAALSSLYFFRQQQKVSQLVLNTHFLNDNLHMISDHHDLLALHGIEEQDLAAHNIKAHELIYMLNTLFSAQAYYSVGTANSIQLSPYRKILLSHPKFKTAWHHFIKDRMTVRSPFSDAIDAFYAKEG